MAKRPAPSNKSTENEEQRSKNGLLSPSSITRLRQEKGESQNRFAQTLGIPQNSLNRYEQDILLQTKSTDNLLRIIEKFPETYDFLSELHGFKSSGIEKLSELFPFKAKVEEGYLIPEEPYSYLFASATNGIGQTQTMVNVALNFAKHGDPICIIDFQIKNNLGLEQFELFGQSKTSRSKGVVDYFNQYEKAIETNDKGLLPQIEDYCIFVEPRNMEGIYWIPASSNDSREKGNNINWNSLFNGPYGDYIMRELKWAIKRHTEAKYFFVDGGWKDGLNLDIFKKLCDEIVCLYRENKNDINLVDQLINYSYYTHGVFPLLVPTMIDGALEDRKSLMERQGERISQAMEMEVESVDKHFELESFYHKRLISNDLHYEPTRRPIIHSLVKSDDSKLKQDYQELSEFLMSKDLNSDEGAIVTLKSIKRDLDDNSTKGEFRLDDLQYSDALKNATKIVDNLEANRLLRDIYLRLEKENSISFSTEPIGGISDTNKKSFIHAVMAYALAKEEKDILQENDAIELVKIFLNSNYNKKDLDIPAFFKLWQRVYNNPHSPDELRAFKAKPFKYVLDASKLALDSYSFTKSRLSRDFMYGNAVSILTDTGAEQLGYDFIDQLKYYYIEEEYLARRLSEIFNNGSDYKKLYVKEFDFDEVFFQHKDQLREYINECLTKDNKKADAWLERDVSALMPTYDHLLPDILPHTPIEFDSYLKTIASNSFFGASEANEVFDNLQSIEASAVDFKNDPKLSSSFLVGLNKLRKKFNDNPENLSPSIFLFDAAMARMTDWYHLDNFALSDVSDSVQDDYRRDWKDYFLVQSEKYMEKINSLPEKKCFSFITYDFIDQNEFSEQLEKLLDDVYD